MKPKLLVLFLMVLWTLPQDHLSAGGDVSSGAVHFATCQSCHGENAQGSFDSGAPQLAGLQTWYLVEQLKNFRSGVRGADPQDIFGQQMAAIAKALPDDQAINDVAAYIATLKASPVTRTDTSGNPAKAEDAFIGCTPCHGTQGQGIDTGDGRNVYAAPKLTGQHDWYLIRQLQNYKSRIRGYDAEDKGGRIMRIEVKTLYKDKDISDVVAYIGSIR